MGAQVLNALQLVVL